MESLSPHRVLAVDENDELIDPHRKAVQQIIRKNGLEEAGYAIERIANGIADEAIRAEPRRLSLAEHAAATADLHDPAPRHADPHRTPGPLGGGLAEGPRAELGSRPSIARLVGCSQPAAVRIIGNTSREVDDAGN